jgi:hypothetical protein
MKRILFLSIVSLTLTASAGRAQQLPPPPPAPVQGCGDAGCCGAPAAVAVSQAPCCPSRPVLFPRLRACFRGESPSCGNPCPPARVGLLQRIRDRIADRRAAVSCCTPP